MIWFSLYRFLSEIFLILRIVQWATTINVLDFRVKYSLSLSDFNETWIFSLYFRKILKYKILWKSVEWEPSCSVRTDRTDMTNLIAPFAIFRTHLKTKIWDVNVGYWWTLPQSVFQHFLSSRFCIRIVTQKILIPTVSLVRHQTKPVSFKLSVLDCDK